MSGVLNMDPFGVTRDKHGHKTYSQELTVTSLPSGPVIIGFAQNSFRKHFILPSKKGTSGDAKSIKLANKRAEEYENKLYGSYTRDNTVVDMSLSQVSAVLAKIAETLVAINFPKDRSEIPVVFDFKANIVRQVATDWYKGNSVLYASGTQSTIGFKVWQDKPRKYVITHCTEKAVF